MYFIIFYFILFILFSLSFSVKFPLPFLPCLFIFDIFPSEYYQSLSLILCRAFNHSLIIYSFLFFSSLPLDFSLFRHSFSSFSSSFFSTPSSLQSFYNFLSSLSLYTIFPLFPFSHLFLFMLDIPLPSIPCLFSLVLYLFLSPYIYFFSSPLTFFMFIS